MRDWITNDLGWKIFSIILAFGIWLTVRNVSEGNGPPGLLSAQNIYTNVPVTVVSGTADVSDAQIFPATIAVTVAGASDAVNALQPDKIHAVVNLTGVDGAHSLKWRVDVSAPPHITLLKIDPPDVTVTMSGKQ